MLCSLSLSPSTSGPHWLDRLHSSLGLPAPRPDLTLDHFLAPSRCPPKRTPFNAVTSALADLFHMGDRRIPSPPRKGPRKQPNPKSCCVPVGDRGRKRAAARNAAGVRKKRRTPAVEVDRHGRTSRTDVVVIDTSCGTEGEWKTSKIIFRQGAMWKVRNKKLWNLSRRRRKLSSVQRRNEVEICHDST